MLVDPLGKPVRPELFSGRFRRLSQPAGLRVIHLHLVRHASAVAMDRAGVPPVDAAPPLGHTVCVYVSTYLRPSEQAARSAAHALGAAPAKASEMNLKRPLLQSQAEHSSCPGNALSLGALRSGWRDLNSRPLDPQIGGPVVSCAPELRFKVSGGG